jgi:uncharacterized protein involved in exopolysaccharide biosynthesis
MNHYIIFALGVFFGAFVGMFAVALCVAARDGENAS